MTDDQQFILGVLGVVSTIAIQAIALRKTNQTHDLVNGMSAKRARASRQQGAASARLADSKAAALDERKTTQLSGF